jgi:hypothetical protein
VVCSACAFENQAGMRFCGMCGMPLPQRPITAPGAHSTLNFTRVPVDSRAVRERSASQSGGVLLGVPSDTANGGGRSSTVEPPVASASPTTVPEPVPQTPAKELVPDVPLDEYVQSFHYEPPKDPSEVTMRGDAHVAAVEAPAEADSNAEPAVRGDNIVASSSAAEIKPPVTAVSPSSTKDIDARLGLEPETPTEARIARPRFLDVNEPLPKGTKTDGPLEPPEANGGTTISGPSFLGLSDGPQTWAAAVGVEHGEYAPRNYHWRLWFVAAVILVFAGLGVLEWRAQVHQTDNGPVEVIKTKLRKIGQSAMSEITGESSPPSNDNSKPEIQVQEQPPPQPPQQPTPNDVAGAATTGTTTTQTTTPAQMTQPGDQSAAKSDASNAQTSAATTSAPPAQTPASPPPPDVHAKKPATDDSAPETASSKPPAAKRQSDKNSESEAPAKPVLGADEMQKAKNASDSAAEAAWLWKATAKGNPDAPVQLADMYVKGDGVPRSCEQAVVLLKTAAEKENARARNRLASMYATGTCVPRNRLEAYRWLRSALDANPNSEWARQNRDLIWQQMTPDERVAAARYR